MKIVSTQPSQNQLDFIEKFLQVKTKRFILGTNQYATNIYEELQKKGLDIEAFVDDFSTSSIHKGVKIIKINDLKSGKIIIAATNKTKTAIQKIKALEYDIEPMDYFAFQKYSPLNLIEIEFIDRTTSQTRKTFLNFREDFKKNRFQYEKVFDLLQDNKSKKDFENIINFRLNQDLSFLLNFTFDSQNQYFEDFLPKLQIFFDIGGYKGESSLEFIKRYPQYKSIYIFEPNTNNLDIAKQTFKTQKNIYYFNIGVGKEPETLFYNNQQKQKDTSNHISKYPSQDSEQLKIDSIDNLIQSNQILSKKLMGGGAMMIKMDIEGAEKDAIIGMRQTLLDFHPTLAICVYHKFNDFYQIPKLVLNIRNDYSLFFRHYSETLDESVMFFIPKSKVI